MPSGSPYQAHSRRTLAYRRAFWKKAIPGLLLIDALESRLLLAGAASQLQFLAQPTQTAANSVMSTVQVAVEDGTGLIVTTNTSLITLSIGFGGPVGAQIANGTQGFSTTVSARAVGGIATFSSLQFNTLGTYFIQANISDTSLSLGATSNNFTITAPATQLVFNPQPTTVNAGDQFSLNLAIQDAQGNVVTTDHSTGTVTIATGPSGSTLTGTATATAISGVLSFNGLSLKKSGTYTLLVRDGSLPNATSVQFTVNAGAATGLQFLQQPVNTPASGVFTPLQVAIVDSQGNTVAGDSSSVTLTVASGPPGGSLAGTTTVNAVNGIATFSDLSISQLGSNYTLQAADGSLNVATSNAFAITGPAVKLSFQRQPSQATIGTIITPSIIVTVQDAAGNIVPNDNSNITLTINSGPGTLSGTATVAAINGVATFTDLSLSQMGTYTLTAADGGLTGINSNPFLINGLAAKLAFTTQPTGAASGSSIPSPVRVTVEDSAGNLVINSAANVTISIGSGPGGASLTGNTTVTAVNGVATFNNLVLSPRGTYTLSAASPGLTGDLSASFVVNPSASMLVFTTEPNNVAAKSAMYPAVVVKILDLNGNTVTTNTSTVTLALVGGPAGATMGGTTTVSAVAGVATFSNLAFAKQGTYTLVAYDGSLSTVTSQDFVVAGAATRLAFLTQPLVTVTAGQALPDFTVKVTDVNTQLVGSDHSTVTLKIGKGPAGATIVGSATASTVNGIATFSGITLEKAGPYTFTISDGSLTGATSSKFTVTPDLASAQIGGLVPMTTLVGKTLNTAIAAQISDQFGNPISTVTNAGTTPQSVAISIIGGPTAGTLSGTTNLKFTNGLAKFNNLSINTAGIYTLRVDAVFGIAGVGGVTFTESGTMSTTISPVVTTVRVPDHAGSYKAAQKFNLSATVKSLVASGGIHFTGVVDLIDQSNQQVLAHGSIGAGGTFTVASDSDGAIPNGSYTVRIVYEGDTNHTGASSPAFNLKIATTATTLKANPTSLPAGTDGSLTLTATIASTAGVTTPRTGTITFLDNGVAIGSPVLVVNNAASLIINGPSNTLHQYSAVYSGDTANAMSTSPIVFVNVGS